MDLIVAETLGLVAHAAVHVVECDWAIAARMNDCEEWQIDHAVRQDCDYGEFAKLMETLRNGGADHPGAVFHGHPCLVISTSKRHWVCLGWNQHSRLAMELSAGQSRIIDSLEFSLSDSDHIAHRLTENTDEAVRDVVASMQQAAAVVDLQGCLLAISTPFAETFGWPEQSLLGRSIPLIWQGGHTRRAALLTAAGRGVAMTAEAHVVRRSGEPLPVRLSLKGIGGADYDRVLIQRVA